MSRLNDLIRQVARTDEALASDLRREVAALADRRSFGLNFERHVPEAVELPGRPVRRGDKVRILPPRGETPKTVDERVWRVVGPAPRTNPDLMLSAIEDAETPLTKASRDDLVVVAEFRDPVYPGLVSTGKVELGGNKPFHTVINAENYYALQALMFTHRGKVDAIYVDPPYNTGAKDWKYNNDYVEGDDLYRHSKWLAFMERRLLLAKELLNPGNSILIVTIDEKEYLRLGLLLEQIYPDARIQMISSVISQKGSARSGEFSRCDEFIFFVQLGAATPTPQEADMLSDRVTGAGAEVEWGRLTRNGANGRRSARPNLHYPIFFAEDGEYHSTGEPLPEGAARASVTPPDRTIAVFPTATDGREMSWALSHEKFERNVQRGYVKFGKLRRDAPQPVRIYYLTEGYVKAAERGDIVRAPGSTIRWLHRESHTRKPLTVWNVASHNAAEGGTNLLKRLLKDRRFPFPKSLYAVEDALRFFVGDKPGALVVDFFSGSGTTAHAVMRLNKQDGGRRRSISVTNNEVSAEEQKVLRREGLRPGDPDWEALGISSYITEPRVTAAITGETPDGDPIKGDYKFNDEFPMADGLKENVEFFTLTYEAPLRVASHRDFERIAPFLWLRAGSRGRRIEEISAGWDVAEAYGVLANLDLLEPFLDAVRANPNVGIAFIITDEDRLFETISRELPDHVEPVRLYESYLRNFEIATGKKYPVKFTLKDYQADGVDDVLRSLERATQLYDVEGKEVSVSLSATTGAGKTVMAAAVIEALFYGNEAFDFDADPGGVVIWFSDDPNLNDQTRFRLMEASEKLASTDLVTIQPPFAKPQLEPGKVYFLNTQKLSKTSLLTRGHEADDEGVFSTMTAAAHPDLQGWTIWETIANTIGDENLTVYLILDEAHRGFDTKASRDKPTIVRNLVNGHAGYPPIPIVLGISATIERFKEAMAAADAEQTRRALPPVTVDGFRVQESGLVKDAVVLDIPAESGNFDTVLVRRAAKKLRESTERWQAYSATQRSADVVWPLLVLQAPNTPDPDQLARALDEIFGEFQGLGSKAVRHVFGDHTTQTFGTWEVDWIEPQRVQESDHVRILVAKDAISTGWDCPRAEVMVSFRPAKDHTHITQLLGRMVRNPLARRVPGDEKLNSVDCILPFFDRTTAGNVVKFLTGQADGVPDPSSRKTIIEECLLAPNAEIAESVWAAWDALPTMTIPQRGAAPMKRLVALALALSADGLRQNALAEVQLEINRVLDALKIRYELQVKKAVAEIWAVRLQEIRGVVGDEVLTYTDITEKADDRAIQVGFADAKKAFGADVAQSYVDHLAGDDDDSLREAYVMVSALATSKDVRIKVDLEADEIAIRWFDEHRVAIKGLTDERQQAYEDIRALATVPQRGELKRPRTRIEDYVEVLENGQQAVAPTVDRHLMADGEGQFPIGPLNEWEREVVAAELGRQDSVGWYRNPPRQAVDSLGVPYRDDVGNWRSMHPDFIFFNEIDGRVLPSIVDPHGHHLEDSLVKLHGLARFAEDYGDEFHRIEAISKIGAEMRVLDLQQATAREEVLRSTKPPEALYASALATVYDG